MSIPTQMSLVGFIANPPDLHFTAAGAECVPVRVARSSGARMSTEASTSSSPTLHDDGGRCGVLIVGLSESVNLHATDRTLSLPFQQRLRTPRG